MDFLTAMAEEKKRGARKRHWCFTSFRSYADFSETKFDAKVVRYVIFQEEECKVTHRRHIQGYIEFFDCMRIGQVKGCIGESHLEVRRGSRTEAREYCKKADTAVAGTQFEWGEWREDKTRKRKLSEILKSNDSLDDIVENNPEWFVRYPKGLKALFARREEKEARAFRENLTVEVLVGPTGCGKTRRATEGDDWFLLPTSDRLWFDGYRGQKTLILDDFYGGIKYSSLLRILDGHCQQVQVKGGFVYARWTKVIITSNNLPATWYKAGLTPALARRITTVVQLPQANAAVHALLGMRGHVPDQPVFPANQLDQPEIENAHFDFSPAHYGHYVDLT